MYDGQCADVGVHQNDRAGEECGFDPDGVAEPS